MRAVARSEEDSTVFAMRSPARSVMVTSAACGLYVWRPNSRMPFTFVSAEAGSTSVSRASADRSSWMNFFGTIETRAFGEREKFVRR